MGNRNAKKINQDAENEGNRINRDADRFDNYIWGRIPEAGQHGRDIWNRQFGTYNDILGGNYSGRTVGGPGGGGGGRSGGNLGGYENYFKNFGSGIDEAGQNRARGLGVFDEYAKTGGFSASDKSDFINQATGAVPRFYESIANELDRMKGVQGGYSPGFDAQMAKVAREKTQAGQQAILDANVNFKNIYDQNRKWGTEGASSSELGLQDLMTRNKLESMGSAARLNQAQSDMDFRDQQSQRDDDYRWTFGALGGLQDMYNSAPGEENMLLGNLNDSRNIRGGQYGANLDRRMAYNPNVSPFDRVMGGLQTIGGLGVGLINPFRRNQNAPTSPGQPVGRSMPYGNDFSQFMNGPQISNPFRRF